jgi:hypothetical protein
MYTRDESAEEQSAKRVFQASRSPAELFHAKILWKAEENDMARELYKRETGKWGWGDPSWEFE